MTQASFIHVQTRDLSMVGVDLLVDLFPSSVGQLDLRAGTGVSVLVVGASFAAWAFLGAFWWFIAVQFQPLRKLDGIDKFHGLSLMTRSLYNLWCLPFGVWYLLFDDNLHLDIVLESDKTAKLLCLISLGYFVYGSVLSVLNLIISRSLCPKTLLRHLIYSCILALVVFFDIGYYYAIVGSLLEAVDLPSSLSWLLTHLKMAGSKPWRINQAILIHLTHCRWVMEFYWFYLTWKHYTSVSTNLPLPLTVVIYSGLLLTAFVDTPYSVMTETNKVFGRSAFATGKPPPVQTGKTSSSQSPKKKGMTSLGQSKEAQLSAEGQKSPAKPGRSTLDKPAESPPIKAAQKGKAGSTRSRRKRK